MNPLAKLFSAVALTSLATLSMAQPVQSPAEAPASEAAASEAQTPVQSPASEAAAETPAAQ